MASKFRSQAVFGAASLAVGIVALYIQSRKGSNAGTTIIPALQAASTPTDATTAANTQAPAYQSTNFGPRHVYRKARQQAEKAATESTCGACCDNPCGNTKRCANAPVAQRQTNIQPSTWATMLSNMSTVYPPQSAPPASQPIQSSAIAQYNNNIVAPVSVFASQNFNDEPLIANVPAATPVYGGYIQ
jgi:hypothetical protein